MVLATMNGSKSPVIGVLGGGQLGRMMVAAGHRLGIEMVILDPEGSKCPSGQLGVKVISGSFREPDDIRRLAAECDIITAEIEHIDAHVLEEIEQSGMASVHPSPKTFGIIQDKFIQKQFFSSVSDVKVAPFQNVTSLEDAEAIGATFGYPYMLKSRRLAYDGRGNAVISDKTDIPSAFTKLGATDSICLYAEKWVPYVKEIAVMVVKAGDDIRAYPVVETIQKENICHTVLAPASISSGAMESASKMAIQAVKHLEGNGIYGVELFLTAEDDILLNEIAPRPHNSGHYTIEACETDQFEQHLRAISGLHLGSCSLRVGAALMVNILGTNDEKESYALFQQSLSIPGASLHYYGKEKVRPGRKLGHCTIVGSSIGELKDRVTLLSPSLWTWAPTPVVGIVMGSDSDLPTMCAAAEILEKFEIPYDLTVVSAHRTPHRMYQYATTAHGRNLKVIIAGAGGAAHLPGMIAALTPLPVIGVPVRTSTMNGQDSLYSIVQMPHGVPVATVAIGNATNAALLAVRMLGGNFTNLMKRYLESEQVDVEHKAETLETQGWRAYMANRKV